MHDAEEKAQIGGAGRDDAKARREFLKRAAAVALTAPAVTLLMSAKPSKATLVLSGQLNDNDKDIQ